MVTRYGVQFAIYYALLTIPEQCTRRFIQTLLHLGARVPRCLIQVLVQSYGKAEYQQRKQKGLKHDPFTITIQRIPFEGYVTLINQTSTLDIQRDSLAHFSSSLTHPTDLDWQKELDHHLFFPIPTHTAHNFRPILKLAQMDPMRYERIAPLFSIDPIARAALWQSILSTYSRASSVVHSTPQKTKLYSIKPLLISSTSILEVIVIRLRWIVC
ncbi:hypothetical protein G6F36_014988 [Rhizopus arrhizus]|nr:hypothetical protein G6F36_014988 [Rhizopus arrhizus]